MWIWSVLGSLYMSALLGRCLHTYTIPSLGRPHGTAADSPEREEREEIKNWNFGHVLKRLEYIILLSFLLLFGKRKPDGWFRMMLGWGLASSTNINQNFWQIGAWYDYQDPVLPQPQPMNKWPPRLEGALLENSKWVSSGYDKWKQSSIAIAQNCNQKKCMYLHLFN